MTDTVDPVPELAVVIPAWNERENLEVLLPALRETVQDTGVSSEIIVADAGSRRGTREAPNAAGRGTWTSPVLHARSDDEKLFVESTTVEKWVKGCNLATQAARQR